MIALKTNPVVFLVIVFLLPASAYLVFRRIVRRDYLLHGRLTGLSSSLQLLIFAGIMGFPYLFNPPEWPWFWILNRMPDIKRGILGMGIIVLGFIVAFGTMGWFGMRRAFGLEAKGLIHTGPYKITRNPQILGGYLLVIGVSVQWLSWFSLVWIVLYGLIGHWMIITEEEHLRAVLGEEYVRYCEQTPRYLLKFGSRRRI